MSAAATEWKRRARLVARLFFTVCCALLPPRLHCLPLFQAPLRASFELQDMQEVDDQRGKGQKKGAGIYIPISVSVAREPTTTDVTRALAMPVAFMAALVSEFRPGEQILKKQPAHGRLRGPGGQAEGGGDQIQRFGVFGDGYDVHAEGYHQKGRDQNDPDAASVREFAGKEPGDQDTRRLYGVEIGDAGYALSCVDRVR